MKGGNSKASKKGDSKFAVKKQASIYPKRPASAFFVFMEDFRKQYKEKHPQNKSVAAVGKAGGDKWRSLSEEEKALFVVLAKKQKKELERKMEAYNRKLAGDDGDDESDKLKSAVNDEYDEDGSVTLGGFITKLAKHHQIPTLPNDELLEATNFDLTHRKKMGAMVPIEPEDDDENEGDDIRMNEMVQGNEEYNDKEDEDYEPDYNDEAEASATITGMEERMNRRMDGVEEQSMARHKAMMARFDTQERLAKEREARSIARHEAMMARFDTQERLAKEREARSIARHEAMMARFDTQERLAEEREARSIARHEALMKANNDLGACFQTYESWSRKAIKKLGDDVDGVWNTVGTFESRMEEEGILKHEEDEDDENT